MGYSVEIKKDGQHVTGFNCETSTEANNKAKSYLEKAGSEFTATLRNSSIVEDYTFYFENGELLEVFHATGDVSKVKTITKVTACLYCGKSLEEDHTKNYCKNWCL